MPPPYAICKLLNSQRLLAGRLRLSSGFAPGKSATHQLAPTPWAGFWRGWAFFVPNPPLRLVSPPTAFGDQVHLSVWSVYVYLAAHRREAPCPIQSFQSQTLTRHRSQSMMLPGGVPAPTIRRPPRHERLECVPLSHRRKVGWRRHGCGVQGRRRQAGPLRRTQVPARGAF